MSEIQSSLLMENTQREINLYFYLIFLIDYSFVDRSVKLKSPHIIVVVKLCDFFWYIGGQYYGVGFRYRLNIANLDNWCYKET